MVKEKNGYKYSLQPFEEYKFRAKFVAENIRGRQIINVDIYTTNTDRYDVQKLLVGSAISKHEDLDRNFTKVIHWQSKAQDDLDSEFLDELLKELDDETK